MPNYHVRDKHLQGSQRTIEADSPEEAAVEYCIKKDDARGGYTKWREIIVDDVKIVFVEANTVLQYRTIP